MIQNPTSEYLYEWIKYTHKEVSFSHKKEWNLAIRNNVDGIWGHYAKWNKSEKDKYYLITCAWKLKKPQWYREQIGGY